MEAFMTMHANQIPIDTRIARELIDDQFPQWRNLAVRPLESTGTVHAIFRIGEELCARFPLQIADVDETRQILEREANAARALAKVTPIPTPLPVELGRPGSGYPLPWSVQTYLVGSVASELDPSGSTRFAQDLARFIAAIQTADTAGAQFQGDGRGGDLLAHDAWVEDCFSRSEHLLDIGPLRLLWNRFRTLPRKDPDKMAHGDLISGNVLVTNDRLVGVIDVGGFGPADPALDLMGAWNLCDSGPRQTLRRMLGCDDLQWERGKAWAFEQALGAAWYYVDSNPTMSRMAVRTLDRILHTSDTS
jgi:aminoglycoside phosphotransferase (APT) family kinase protein